MSIQALTWAFQQDIYNRAKNVLFSLANHADHTNGYCYPSIELIMKEASVSRSSAYAFIGALRRNDYITVKIIREKSGKRSYHFWLNFDRADAPWISTKSEADDLPEEVETQDVDEIPNPGLEETAPNVQDLDARVQELDARVQELDGGIQDLDSPYIRLEPSDKPSESLLEDSTRATPPEPPPRSSQPLAQADKPRAFEQTKPHGFDPSWRQRETGRLKAAEEARRGQLVPVIEGSAPWDAWMTVPDPRTGKIHSSTLTCTIKLENGRLDRGWYFPTLWPKKHDATGPPLPKETKKAG